MQCSLLFLRAFEVLWWIAYSFCSYFKVYTHFGHLSYGYATISLLVLEYGR